jgi:hypothetical protein
MRGEIAMSFIARRPLVTDDRWTVGQSIIVIIGASLLLWGLGTALLYAVYAAL